MAPKITDRLICFDLDGVLIDSTNEVNTIFGEVMKRELGLTSEKLRDPKVASLTPEERFSTLWPEVVSQGRVTEAEVRHALELYRRDKVSAPFPLCPHAAMTVRRLSAMFKHLAVVSGNRTAILESILTRLELRDYFDDLIGTEQANRGKPDPEMYLVAARRFGITPEHCLAIEDSTPGIESARAAGMKVVGVTTGAETIGDLENAGPDLIITDLSGLTLGVVFELLKVAS